MKPHQISNSRVVTFVFDFFPVKSHHPDESLISRWDSQVIKRFTLQRLRAAELLEFWLDVSHLGVGSEQHAQQAAITAFQSLKGLLQAVMQLEVGIRDTVGVVQVKLLRSEK